MVTTAWACGPRDTPLAHRKSPPTKFSKPYLRMLSKPMVITSNSISRQISFGVYLKQLTTSLHPRSRKSSGQMDDKVSTLKQLRCFKDRKARALSLSATESPPPLLSRRPNAARDHQAVTLAYGICIGNVRRQLVHQQHPATVFQCTEHTTRLA